MSAEVAIIAALVREIAPLVEGWTRHTSANRVSTWSRGSIVVACAGMGPERAALAVGAALKLGPDVIYSVGLAGACDPVLEPGDIVRAEGVIDVRSGERFGVNTSGAVLVTSPTLASVGEKRRLRESYGAEAVDMEAATVARLARAHSLEFRAIKAISDGADFELEDLARFATADGQFREGAFALHAAIRPSLWPRVFALSQNSRRAVAALTGELRSQLNLKHEQQG